MSTPYDRDRFAGVYQDRVANGGIHQRDADPLNALAGVHIGQSIRQ
jgi:hypothetical protein